MIALDTNVILRYMLKDDDSQTSTADKVIRLSPKGSLLITDVTLVEVYWVISQRNKAPRDRIVEAIDALLREPSLQFENKEVVVRAIEDFRYPKPGRTPGGKEKQCDFPDMLILHKAASLGADYTFTFDYGLHPYTQARLPEVSTNHKRRNLTFTQVIKRSITRRQGKGEDS